jgi:hypothetical protein
MVNRVAKLEHVGQRAHMHILPIHAGLYPQPRYGLKVAQDRRLGTPLRGIGHNGAG